MRQPVRPRGLVPRVTRGVAVPSGSLCPEGTLVESAGVAVDDFEGTTRVSDRERAAMDALEDGTIQAGYLIVREMTSRTESVAGSKAT